jgi:hypothetical protein
MKKGNIPFFTFRKTTRENFRLSIRETYVLAFLLIALLGIYYVFVLNTNATKWYAVRNLEIIRKNYLLEESLLNIKIAEAESLTTLANTSTAEEMIQIDAPRYLILKDSIFVYKK